MNWKSKAKALFFEFVSFSSPRARVINLSSIFLVLALIPTKLLGVSPVKCIFKTYIIPFIFNNSCPGAGIFAGCNCPACGMTRAMSRLMHGDLTGAWAFNALVFLVFGVMIVIIVADGIRIYKSGYKSSGKKAKKRK